MDIHDLKRLIALGEGSHLEFKHRVPRSDRIAREVIALANTRGGKVLLGVSDDGSLIGVKDSTEELFALRNALDEHCEPPVHVDIEGVRISRRREVLVIDVPLSGSKPHFLVGEKRNGQNVNGKKAYVRVGAESVEASTEAVKLMKAERSPRDTRFTFGDNEQQLMRYLERYERITVREYARLAAVPEKRASHTLVLMARAGVLQLHADPQEDYFTVAYESDT
ncbi:MAG: ATP-binding protein [Rubricoccaceae bacterium]|nr:ATP-binding protein [Rubricoccaceae bacterium]